MESIGETLRDARHRKQVELTDAARATKIKPDILEQLEAGDFTRLAAPTYTRAFLKLYADYLGLDGKQIVDAYLASQGGLHRQGLHLETEVTIRAMRARELRLPLARVAAVVTGLTLLVFAGYLGVNWWTHRAERQAQHQPPPPPAVAPAPAAARIVAATPVTWPRADFEPYYQPKTSPVPDALDLSGK